MIFLHCVNIHKAIIQISLDNCYQYQCGNTRWKEEDIRAIAGKRQETVTSSEIVIASEIVTPSEKENREAGRCNAMQSVDIFQNLKCFMFNVKCFNDPRTDKAIKRQERVTMCDEGREAVRYKFGTNCQVQFNVVQHHM